MKKSIFLAALALMTGMALTSCENDTYPRLQDPTGEFKLYEPANNNYTYDLTDNSNTITLTTSGQPDYGVAVVTQYQVQVSLDDTWEDGIYDEETEEYTVYPTYYSLSSVNTQSVITASALQLNQAITFLQGLHDEDQADQYDPSVCSLYIRIRAYVADANAEDGYVPYSVKYSNSVKLNKVQPSLTPSFPIPGVMYVIGNYQDWKIEGNDLTKTVTEEEYGIGSNIYSGYVYMTTEQAASGFRFYFELGANAWGDNGTANGVGATTNDGDNVNIELKDNVYSGTVVKGGKGNWNVTNMPADGYLKLTVNLNTMNIEIKYAPDYKE